MHQLARHAATTAHLVLAGALGPVVILTLGSYIAAAVMLIPALGIGLILLLLVGPVLFGLAWLEERRAAGLLDLDIPERRMRTSTRSDWLRIPMTLLIQFADPRTWLALLHAGVVMVLGFVAIGALWAIGESIGLIASPIVAETVRVDSLLGFGVGDGLELAQPMPPILGALGIVIGVLALLGLSIAHRALSAHMLVPSREAELEEAVETASAQRTQAMRAAEVERTRIERDLHDGVQPRLVSIGMQLGMAKSKLDRDPAGAARLIDEAHASTKTAVVELRQLARGINPAILKDRGLDAALSGLVARSHIPVQLEVGPIGRCSETAEAAMYFVVAEALTNAAKHSDATRCRVRLERRDNGRLWARIEDDGRGGARRIPGGGLDGLANRVEAAGGAFSLSSPEGGPTTIEASLPCAS